ncbi:hypothetical protein D7B24_002087 [Verticillium nonalfalfae]|uniref:Uncharacterized protein n=1 Tax=Verticillium nonalfalfae TaxID=1051616 RepID=A0A3M9Y277_9PEZI|nr:uncharacterized protein D7B24_002087 [Verticillium nonalfalfae]RNJ53240.1 hypothetical protein D7B24_002087 [Verticillium nonalfalfae]
MAAFFPAEDELVKRQFGCPSGTYYRNGRCYTRNRSSWYYWGRWVLAGVLVVVFLLILCALGCFSSRKRRRKGNTPMYGTGWMTNNRWGANQHQNNQHAYNQQGYNQQQYGQQQYGYGQQGYNAPPAYGQQPQHTGTTFNQNDGYYGNHDNIQLQQPQQTYNRGVDDFAPPSGPPPKA